MATSGHTPTWICFGWNGRAAAERFGGTPQEKQTIRANFESDRFRPENTILPLNPTRAGKREIVREPRKGRPGGSPHGIPVPLISTGQLRSWLARETKFRVWKSGSRWLPFT